MKLDLSILGGHAVLLGDQRWNACFTVVVHCELVWQRVVSPLQKKRYGSSLGWNSNCSESIQSCSHGATSLLTVVTVGP